MKQLGVGPPRRAARRGPATWYTSTSTVPPGIMHDGIVRRGPARRHALRRLHRGVKQLGVGPPRGVQLGVVGLHRGVEQLGAGAHRGVHSAWGRTVAGVGRQRAWGSPGRLSARSSQSARRPFRGDASSARAARVGTAESTQVDRAEGSKRERDEGPKRERSVPVLLSYRREAFKRGQVARSGQERQADRAEGSRGEEGRTRRGKRAALWAVAS